MFAAGGRALHLFQHGSGALAQDWLAWPLLGPQADDLLAMGRAIVGDASDPFATWFGARARLADDWLRATDSVQHVILGAGLDSSAWRSPDGPTVFEVDHPATQEWKRSRVAALDLRGEPVWVPVDFEEQHLGEALARAGVRDDGRVFVSWLGVIPYLTEDAAASTLRELPPCSLAVSYVIPETSWDDPVRTIGATVRAIAADAGEPWISLMTPDELSSLLVGEGFDVSEDVGPSDIAPRYGLPALNYERMMLARKR
jgi:methyltransferase (TIGR00027 family)